MASAVIRTYERKPGFSRNSSMKKPHGSLNGYGLDPVAPERSYTSETVADSSEICRPRAIVTAGPCVAQNFSTIRTEPPSETASEDSCSLKRKSMSLNGDVPKESFVSGFGVSIRDLNRSEKSQLRQRLKVELHHVMSLSKKVEDREIQVRSFSQAMVGYNRSGTNGSTANGHYFPAVMESFHRDGQFSRHPSLVIPELNYDMLNSVGRDKRTPKANQLYASSDFLSGKDKLPPPEKHKSRSGPSAKRSLQGGMDSRDAKRSKVDVSYTRKMSELLKQCCVILKKLMGHKFSWVFNEPVDVVKLNLHDYFKIIKRPMDLGTIKRKLDMGAYMLPTEFCDDVRLTFANAMKYNPQGHDVYAMADTLRGVFEGKWKTMEEKVRELDTFHDRLADLGSRDHLLGTIEQALPAASSGPALPSVNRPAPARKSKPPSTGKPAPKSKAKAVTQSKRPMTFAEKQHLSECLGNLPADKLEQAVQIMRKNPNLMQNDDEIEVDIESFDPDTLWELHRFVMDSRGTSANEARSVQAGPQAVSDPQMPSGAIKASKGTVRGTEAGEEDIDIEDDLPAKEFPPVVIEKDRGANTKEGSSSSSSSSSGSSSSDSDSASSSGSESDADEGHSAGAVAKFSSADKEPVGSAAVGVRRGSPTVEDGVKSYVNNAGVKNTSSTKPSSTETGPQDEGNGVKGEACHERQARAALLRSRFAETILKAQEKTLPLNKSDNPEKLRKEQEELERRRKEEKARLHAEARAVELARKKAELAAAAEAKQRRAVEREAARLALQNMEKTVEIDESMEVLKDLERLRSGPLEHVPSSGDETSPVHSQDGLPSFGFQGANPLERLGLFMRSDEEEEQEEYQDIDRAVAPHSSS